MSRFGCSLCAKTVLLFLSISALSFLLSFAEETKVSSISLDVWSYSEEPAATRVAMNPGFLSDNYVLSSNLVVYDNGRHFLRAKVDSPIWGVVVSGSIQLTTAERIGSSLKDINATGIVINTPMLNSPQGEKLFDALLISPTITHIHIAFSYRNAPSWIFEKLSSRQTLKTLYVDMCTSVDAVAFESFAVAKADSLKSLFIMSRLIPMTSVEKMTSLEKLRVLGFRDQGIDLTRVHRLKNLRHLSVITGVLDEDGSMFLTDMPQLEYLSIVGNMFGEVCPKVMSELENLKNLKHLGLPITENPMIEQVSKCTGLTSLKIVLNGDFTPSFAPMGTLRELRKLTVALDTRRTPFPDLPHGLASLKSIAVIGDLTALSFSQKTLDVLSKIDAMKLVPHMELNNQVSLQLGTLTGLKTLSVPIGRLTDSFVQNLRTLQSLTTLAINCPFLSDKSAEVVSGLSTLERLYLNNCTNWTDSQFKLFGRLKGLKVLEIYLSPYLTQKGLEFASDIPSLKHLGLASTKVTLAQLKMLHGNSSADYWNSQGSLDAATISFYAKSAVKQFSQGILASAAVENGLLPSSKSPPALPRQLYGFQSLWFTNSAAHEGRFSDKCVVLFLPLFYQNGMSAFYLDENNVLWEATLSIDDFARLKKLAGADIDFSVALDEPRISEPLFVEQPEQ
ncbi:MAG: hypothetical protein U5N86_04975 [Planctomycetota bacterium]|nr:hypothetical protein [Planctomycetota bacterium]